jgi:tetratricopeptide (TPR) repeat protein
VFSYINRGFVWEKKKDYGKAMNDFDEALKLDPKNAGVYNARAWQWATCPDAKFRDGKKAVESAKRAVELDPEPNNMDTLAAAYAEAGDFAEAVRWQVKAMEEPRYRDNPSYRRRLELYRDKKSYREE